MKHTITITDQEIYDANVIDVNLRVYRNGNSFFGDVDIESYDLGQQTITGEHGADDYEHEYGFVIECIYI